jgi:hypothetical protein
MLVDHHTDHNKNEGTTADTSYRHRRPLPYRKHTKLIDERIFNIFEVASVNHDSDLMGNKFSNREVERHINDLRYQLKQDGEGVHLLVFVLQGRITDRVQQCYEMFYNGIFNQAVPIVIAITGMENELSRYINEDMDNKNPNEQPVRKDDWWSRNKQSFINNGLFFKDHACLVATKGRRLENDEHIFEDLYNLSKRRFEELIRKNCTTYMAVSDPRREGMANANPTKSSSLARYLFFFLGIPGKYRSYEP